VRAVIMGIPRRLVLFVEVLLAGIPGVPSHSNDLPVAVGHVECLASLAHAFPPIWPEAVAGVIEVPR